jgi:FeS assembly SUF system regulator
MIRMSKMTDYGIVVLREFASAPEGETLTTRDISDVTKIPQPTVSKLLKKFTKGGLLLSHRGKTGGYALAKSPHHISLVEIIRVLEGPVSLTDCSVADGNCDQESHCSVRGHWKVINEVVEAALARVALSSMAAKNPKSAETLPMV